MVVWKVIRWNYLIIVMVASSSNNLLKGDACWMDIELGMIYIERNYIRNELIKKEKILLKKK